MRHGLPEGAGVRHAVLEHALHIAANGAHAAWLHHAAAAAVHRHAVVRREPRSRGRELLRWRLLAEPGRHSAMAWLEASILCRRVSVAERYERDGERAMSATSERCESSVRRSEAMARTRDS